MKVNKDLYLLCLSTKSDAEVRKMQLDLQTDLMSALRNRFMPEQKIEAIEYKLNIIHDYLEMRKLINAKH
jgi:hypothetical protein